MNCKNLIELLHYCSAVNINCYRFPEVHVSNLVILCPCQILATIAGVNLGFQACLWALKFNFERFLQTIFSDARIPLLLRLNLICLVIEKRFLRQFFFKQCSNLGVKIGFLPHLFVLWGHNSSLKFIFFLTRRSATPIQCWIRTSLVAS